MAYCVNPYCQDPDNSIASGSSFPISSDTLCSKCHTPLLLQGRYTLLGPPLCDRNPTLHSSNARIFEVQDKLDPRTPKVLKVLLDRTAPLPRLFEQEQQLLMTLEHEGIPKGYDAFDVVTPYEQLLSCLVMEKIIGQNLQERRLILGPIAANTALNWLKQLAEILHHIHQQNFFHRDIKPSNIMQRSGNDRLVLIDFGTAKRMAETTVAGNTSTVVLSYNYTAPEQLNGQAERRSDFYALGKTILYLMTDLPQSDAIDDGPPANQEEFMRRSQVKLSPSFNELLFDLIHPSVNRRPRDTSELLERIKDVTNEATRRKSKDMALLFAGGMICGATIMTPLIKQINWGQFQQSLLPTPVCDIDLADSISCGEEMLLDGLEEGVSSPDEKKLGVQAFREGDYRKAQELFQKAFDRERDPETLIYLNNTKIRLDSQFQSQKVTISATVPLGNKNARNRAIAMLRGVAQAQNDAMSGYSLGLQVVVVDDENDPGKSNVVAQKLVKRKDVLGGMGHASSEALIAALPHYESNQFVFIAPASTSEELSSAALRKEHTFFRSLPSNRTNANFMTALLTGSFNRPKISIYYSNQSSYSRSLAAELRSTYQIHGGEVLNDDRGLFRIEETTFDAKKSLQYARDRGARVHILIPDGAVKRSSAVNSLALVKENAGQDWIIAGDSLAGVPEYLKGGDDGFAQYSLGKMIFSSAWDPSADLGSPLLTYWNSQKQSKSLVDWRTFTSYNAVWLMATALDNQAVRNREQLREKLSSPNFKTLSIGSGDESQRQLGFQEQSGEIANPKIYLSIVAKCDDRYTTVLYKNPVCPDGKPAFPNSKFEVTK